MTKEKLRRILIVTFAIVVIVISGFRLLAGEQFEYRDSRFNIVASSTADSNTGEASSDTIIEQRFINKIDRLKGISIQCTTHYRTNYGVINIGVYNNGTLLFDESFKVSSIKENEPIVVESNEYLEDLTGKELTIVITSTSVHGEAVSPLVCKTSQNGTSLKVNDRYLEGSLLFSAYGQEYIFTGQYYWYMAFAIWIVVAILLFVTYRQFCNGRSNYVVLAIEAISRYKFLISQLVARDFKSKYKRSVLGIFWSFLNPLLTMTVQYFVFSTFFVSDTKNYLVYLLVGVVCYNFFNEATTMCLTSISGNARLITKVYIPKYIFPFSRTISSMVNLGISLIPLLLVSLITGLVLQKSAILIFYFLACLVVFALGVGMFLATLMVFFRDIQFLWSVLSMIWMYATPIFYPASIIPEKYSFIIDFNPLYHFIKNVRMCLIDGVSPGPRSYIFCFIFAIGSLLIGSYVFKKQQDKFTLYL